MRAVKVREIIPTLFQAILVTSMVLFVAKVGIDIATPVMAIERSSLLANPLDQLRKEEPLQKSTPQPTAISHNLVPSRDNVFTLGTSKMRWKSLQLGPGTLYIQDQLTGKQAGLTVKGGVLLLDGAESISLGNIQITKSGIKSDISSNDITIGSPGDTGFLSTARGIKFPDGSIQYSASTTITGATGSNGAIGLTGPTGLTGATGAQGATGLAGAQGATGSNGAQGAQGATGSNGAQGAQGATGSNGATGLTGDSGLSGAQGLQGETGQQGLQGIAGAQGIQGVTGATGAALSVQGSYANLSLFNSANVVGSVGEAWIIADTGDLFVWNVNLLIWQSVGQIQGPQGTSGPQGIAGVQGPMGIQGATGDSGLQGSQGVQGEPGLQGPQGVQGLQGLQGVQGVQGIDGIQGAIGPSSPTVVIGYGSGFARNAINYFSSGVASTIEGNVVALFPATSVSKLSIRIPTAPGAGLSYAFTVMNAGIATTLTCTISGTATSCSDLTHSANFLNDSTFSIRVAPTGNPAGTTGANWSIRLTL